MAAAFPAGLSLATVTAGPVLATDGTPVPGVTVVLVPEWELIHAASGTRILSGGATMVTGADGTASTQVVRSDAAGLTRPNFTYQVIWSGPPVAGPLPDPTPLYVGAASVDLEQAQPTSGSGGVAAQPTVSVAGLTGAITAAAMAQAIAADIAADPTVRAAFGSDVSALPPANPTPGQKWISSSLTEARVPTSATDRSVLLTATLGWESTAVQEPNLWIGNGRYNLIYTGGSGSRYLGYAWCPLTSDPLVASNWTKNPTPVIGNGNGGLAGTCAHSNVYVEGDTIYCFFVDKSSSPDTLRVATASVTAPTVFTLNPTVVLTLPYSSVNIGNTTVRKVGSTYYMVFEMSLGGWQCGVATGTSPTAAFTPVQSTMQSLWPRTDEQGQAGGPVLYIEGNTAVLWYHGGGRVPTAAGITYSEIYRATMPVGALGTDAWTVLDNGTPAVQRVSAREVDQTADPFVVVNPDGQPYLAWSGLDNRGTVKASIMLSALRPITKVYRGGFWVVTDAPEGARGSVLTPGKRVLKEQTTNLSFTDTAFTQFGELDAYFRPTGTDIMISIFGRAAPAASSGTVRVSFNVTNYSFDVTLRGGVEGADGSRQGFHCVGRMSGLTPGRLYRLTTRAKLDSAAGAGTLYVRPTSFYETASMVIEDVQYPTG